MQLSCTFSEIVLPSLIRQPPQGPLACSHVSSLRAEDCFSYFPWYISSIIRWWSICLRCATTSDLNFFLMLGSLPQLFQISPWLTQEASINCIKNNFEFVEGLNVWRADAHFRDELVQSSRLVCFALAAGKGTANRNVNSPSCFHSSLVTGFYNRLPVPVLIFWSQRTKR